MRPSIRSTFARVPGCSRSATRRPTTATCPLKMLSSTRSMVTRRRVRLSSRMMAAWRTISGAKNKIAAPTDASVTKTIRAISQMVRRRITSAAFRSPAYRVRLRRMDDVFDLETLRHAAHVAGFTWTDEELQALRPVVQASLRLLATLDALPLDGVEPTTQYRIL